jgi:hypothetical protein
MNRKAYISYFGPLLVAMIIAAGPGLGAVHADLARQTDDAQNRRHPQPVSSDSSRPNGKTPTDPSKDSTPSLIAAAPIKPVDTESGARSLALSVDSLAHLIPVINSHALCVSDLSVLHSHLHRPAYLAHAPPVFMP